MSVLCFYFGVRESLARKFSDVIYLISLSISRFLAVFTYDVTLIESLKLVCLTPKLLSYRPSILSRASVYEACCLFRLTNLALRPTPMTMPNFTPYLANSFTLVTTTTTTSTACTNSSSTESYSVLSMPHTHALNHAAVGQPSLRLSPTIFPDSPQPSSDQSNLMLLLASLKEHISKELSDKLDSLLNIHSKAIDDLPHMNCSLVARCIMIFGVL